jgi:hypothetical protein
MLTSLRRMCANAFAMPEFAPVTIAVGILVGCIISSRVAMVREVSISECTEVVALVIMT